MGLPNEYNIFDTVTNYLPSLNLRQTFGAESPIELVRIALVYF
jgi:hypothetical protein